MLRKALTLGMVLILALSVLAVSMITCFTYDAEAGPLEFGHQHWDCKHMDDGVWEIGLHASKPCPPWSCYAYTQ